MNPQQALKTTSAFDVDRIRKDFPMLRRTTRGRPLVYLDNANSTQKPRAVIDAESPSTPSTTRTSTAASTC